MITIKYPQPEPAVVRRHISELKPGAVFMNCKHDPLNPKDNAGLYLVVRNAEEQGVFCTSLRGTALSYEHVRLSTLPQDNMVWMFDIEVKATPRKL